MKLRLLPLAILVLGSSVFAAEMPWKKTYSSALAEAKATNKLIMIDFYTDWCGWCKKLDKDTYTDAKVISQSSKVIPIKVDAEKEGKDLAKKYGVSGYPTILFLDKDGNVQGKIGGYMGPGAFAHEVDKYTMSYNEYPKLAAALKAKPADGENNAKMAAILSYRSDAAKAEAHLAKARSAKYNGVWLSRALCGIGDIYQLSNNLDKAITYFKEADSSTKDAFDRSYAKISLIYCYQGKGDKAAMKKVCQELIAMPGGQAEWVSDAKNMMKG